MNKWILINDKSFSLTKSDLFRPKTNILEYEKLELEPISEETILDTEKKISLNSMYTQVDSNDFDIIEKEEPEILETITTYKKKDVTLNNIYNNLVPIMNTVVGNGISGYEGDGGNALDVTDASTQVGAVLQTAAAGGVPAFSNNIYGGTY